MPDEDALTTLILQAHEAALDPGAWGRWASALEGATGGAVAMLHLDYTVPPGLDSLVAPSVEPDRLRVLVERYGTADNPLVRQAAAIPPGRVIRGMQGTCREEIRAGAFQREWLGPRGLSAERGLQACADRVGASCLVLGLLASPTRPELEERDAELVARLLPHLRQAARTSRRLGALEARLAGFEAVLERSDTGIVLLDHTGRPRARNAAARRVLAEEDGLAERDGRLRAARCDVDAILGGLMASAVAGGEPPGPGGALSIPRRPDRPPLELVVAPLAPCGGEPWRERSALAAVFLADPERRWDPPERILRRLYGLTASEASLARVLIRGATVAEAAESLRITRESARTYTKRVLAKTGAARQSDLVRRVLAGPARFAPPDPTTSPPVRRV
jgi:DNA-binding CsgD family transcriptional regulator